MNISVHTVTHMPFYVIRCLMLSWNKKKKSVCGGGGGLDKVFCCCMSYGGSFRGSLTGSASTLLAAAAITKPFKSPAFRNFGANRPLFFLFATFLAFLFGVQGNLVSV